MARHPSMEFAPEPPADPRPAWERIAYAWLAREVDGGQPVTAAQLASETSVTPAYARDLLRVLRAQRVRARDPRLASLRATPASHGRIHADQLAALAERFRAGAPAPTSPAPGRPLPADALTDQIELAWRRAQVTGKRIDPAQLARELRTSRQSVTNTLTALRAGAPTTRQRIEAAYTAREVEHGEWVNLTDLAAELGTSPAYVKRVVGPLRATHRASQRQPAPPPTGPGEGRVWLDLAAKQVCAACPVQGPCRDLAVVAAASRGDDHGIFGGTKPHERTALRDNPARRPSSWLTDRAAAEEAHRLAVELGPQEAAKQLGTQSSTLRRAWARWGLDYPGRPRASVYARDPDRAMEAFQLAQALGGAKAVTQMATESRSTRQSTRVWAITRRAERAQTLARQRDHRSERRHAERAGRAERDRRPHHPRAQEGREGAADGR